MQNCVPTDCTGYDLSKNAKQHHVVMEFRQRAIKFSAILLKLHRNYSLLHIKGVIGLSNGACYATLVEGLWFSGKYETAAGNSEDRGYLAFTCKEQLAPDYLALLMMVMGDDCDEDNPASKEELIQWYRNEGFRMKVSEGKEFCSHLITSDGVECLRFDKTVFKLACDPTPEHYDQVRALFRTQKQIAQIEQLAVHCRPTEGS